MVPPAMRCRRCALPRLAARRTGARPRACRAVWGLLGATMSNGAETLNTNRLMHVLNTPAMSLVCVHITEQLD